MTAATLPDVPTMLAYLERDGTYVTLRPDRRAWDLDHAKAGSDKAVRTLIAEGYEAARASGIITQHKVTVVHGTDLVPGGPAIIDHGTYKLLNTWVPPLISPVAAPWSTIEDTLRFVALDDDGYGWLFNWMAYIVQSPARRMRTGPALQGRQNTGKSLVARILRALLGEENTRTVRPSDILSRFTATYAGTLLTVVSEVESTDIDAVTASLKFQTGEARTQFEAKGVGSVEIRNQMKFIVTSNAALPLRIDAHDTRWTILYQPATPDPSRTARQAALFEDDDWSDIGRSELGGFLHALLAYPADQLRAETVLQSASRDAAVLASRSSVEHFIDAVTQESLDAVYAQVVPEHERKREVFDDLDVEGRPGITGKAALYAVYRAFCVATGLKPLGIGRFPGELERGAPTWSLRSTTTVKGKVSDERVRRLDGTKVSASYEGVPRNLGARVSRAAVDSVIEKAKRPMDAGLKLVTP